MCKVSSCRNLLWRILGVDYRHILKVIDHVYLKEDPFTKLGQKSYTNNALVFRWSNAPISIGNYSTIADGVRFIVDKGNHYTNCVSTYPFPNNEKNDIKGISIGHDVWIGQNTIILPGVVIGNGVTVAAGSVVTKNIPDYCVVAGVPAKIISTKCTDKEASLMNNIKWWNWADDVIATRLKDFKLPIPQFIAKYNEANTNND